MLSTWPRFGLVGVVGEAQHGDHQRDVGLDRADDVAGRRALLGDQREHAVARLGERREDLERLEGGGEALAVTLVARPADERVRLAGPPAAGGAAGGWRRTWDGVMVFGPDTCGDLEAWRHRVTPFNPIGILDERLSRPAAARRSITSAAAPVERTVDPRQRPSRPSSATVSKIPGETVVPVSATRSGWKTCLALRPVRSTARAAPLDALGGPRLRHLGQRRARAASASRARLGAEELRAPPGRRPARRRTSAPAARTRRAWRSSPA